MADNHQRHKWETLRSPLILFITGTILIIVIGWGIVNIRGRPFTDATLAPANDSPEDSSQNSTGSGNDILEFINRGIAYYEAGNHEQAIAEFDTALVLHPEEASIYRNRALSFYALGDVEQAVDDFNTAIQLDALDASTPLTPLPQDPSIQPDTPTELFHGVRYVIEQRQTPRPMMIHIITIDLTTETIDLLVTPGDDSGGREIPARTTSEFLTEFGLAIAINANFFRPFQSQDPNYYYPYRGDPVDVLGLAISDQIEYSPPQTDFSVLCIFDERQVEINEVDCPSETTQAVAGGPILLDRGVPITRDDIPNDELHPRTAVAIDEMGTTLWLVIVDGRQPGYSEGMMVTELVQIMLDLGAHMALNLDGGGSTTLVTATDRAPQILNRPIDANIPGRERPVANHLGIFAKPLQ